ncbi:MAG: potassium-transporting ATPase subunit F [Magnetococcales bacterium]|nr:potassium-transporting ATPase subunit F [Magnetococcales bacterium]MBF0156456.1 potassium-transporting ATPase subunit F [Magnetococcales bacterium]
MSILYLIGAALAACVFVYLVMVLFLPEKFS